MRFVEVYYLASSMEKRIKLRQKLKETFIASMAKEDDVINKDQIDDIEGLISKCDRFPMIKVYGLIKQVCDPLNTLKKCRGTRGLLVEGHGWV